MKSFPQPRLRHGVAAFWFIEFLFVSSLAFLIVLAVLPSHTPKLDHLANRALIFFIGAFNLIPLWAIIFADAEPKLARFGIIPPLTVAITFQYFEIRNTSPQTIFAIFLEAVFATPLILSVASLFIDRTTFLRIV